MLTLVLQFLLKQHLLFHTVALVCYSKQKQCICSYLTLVLLINQGYRYIYIAINFIKIRLRFQEHTMHIYHWLREWFVWITTLLFQLSTMYIVSRSRTNPASTLSASYFNKSSKDGTPCIKTYQCFGSYNLHTPARMTI